MMKDIKVKIDDIYVPVKRRKELNEDTVETLAESILEEGLQTPIGVRSEPEKKRYVLVTGLHRLEACRSLGEETIDAVLVQSQKH